MRSNWDRMICGESAGCAPEGIPRLRAMFKLEYSKESRSNRIQPPSAAELLKTEARPMEGLAVAPKESPYRKLRRTQTRRQARGARSRLVAQRLPTSPPCVNGSGQKNGDFGNRPSGPKTASGE